MHRIHSFTLAAALAVAFTGASAASAQSPRPQDPAQPANKGAAKTTAHVSNEDRDFVHKAAAAGKKEVEDGKVAAQKASNAQVKSYAKKLVTDHTAANNQLMALAKRKGITIDQATARSGSTADAKDQQTEAWMSATGAAFDRGFIESQVKAHQGAISLFEQQAKNGTDTDLKAFAQKQLPGLRNHLKQAQDLQAKLATSTQ